MNKKIYIGSDHAGFKLKEKIKKWLRARKIPFEDLGNLKYDPDDDYPDFAALVGEKTAREKTKGVLLCGSAEGVCIAANKVKGIRAVNPGTVESAKLSRKHNDANVLCLSGWFGSFPAATKMIAIFLKTNFSQASRHVRRINKIKRLEGLME